MAKAQRTKRKNPAPRAAKGSVVQVQTIPGRCPRCKSTRRDGYTAVREIATRGQCSDGPYTHVVWRRTRCRDCGQMRIDRTYENRPAG